MATARSFALEVGRALPGSPGECFMRLTEDYLAERFGDLSGRRPQSELDHDLANLRSHVRARRWIHTDRVAESVNC